MQCNVICTHTHFKTKFKIFENETYILCVFFRTKDADDMMYSTNEIKALALKIEEALFHYFEDTGHKYKNKYRTLVFNIRDPKNKVSNNPVASAGFNFIFRVAWQLIGISRTC